MTASGRNNSSSGRKCTSLGSHPTKHTQIGMMLLLTHFFLLSSRHHSSLSKVHTPQPPKQRDPSAQEISTTSSSSKDKKKSAPGVFGEFETRNCHLDPQLRQTPP
ncbi:unnamed protein product [Ectocarpus sp. 8 AP-2014]